MAPKLPVNNVPGNSPASCVIGESWTNQISFRLSPCRVSASGHGSNFNLNYVLRFWPSFKMPAPEYLLK